MRKVDTTELRMVEAGADINFDSILKFFNDNFSYNNGAITFRDFFTIGFTTRAITYAIDFAKLLRIPDRLAGILNFVGIKTIFERTIDIAAKR